MRGTWQIQVLLLELAGILLFPQIFSLCSWENLWIQNAQIHRLYANTTPFHIKGSPICGSACPQGSWNPSPMDTEGCDWICFRNSPIWLCEELSGEMKEMKEMNLILLSRVCYFPDCSGFPRKWLQAPGVRVSGLGATRTGRPLLGTRWTPVSRGRETSEWPPRPLTAPSTFSAHSLIPWMQSFSFHS